MTATLVPIADGSITSPQGFTAAAAHAGLKSGGALDVALLVSASSCATAGVFTRNAVRAAPVVYDHDLLSERPGRVRAVAPHRELWTDPEYRAVFEHHAPAQDGSA